MTRTCPVLLVAAVFASACATPPPQADARAAVGPASAFGADPKVNQSFYAPDIGLWTKRFEGESRELYRKRNEIVTASGATPGMAIADVGAGTGFFTMLFAQQVAPAGKVYAVELSQPFIDLISRRTRAENVSNVVPVLSTHTETRLVPRSVDIVFTADTYHHLEQVGPMLASIKSALKPGGRLIVVDFERIPGVTPKQTFDHVRADKQEVIAEVSASGFRLREEISALGLKDNYYLVFERQ